MRASESLVPAPSRKLATKLSKYPCSIQIAWQAVQKTGCPRTMFSRIEQSASHNQVIELSNAERNDDLFLIPGIIATRDATLPTGGLHPLVHGGRPEVQIPVGWWLARGGEYRFTPLLVNLLKFVKDNDGKLAPGTMSVEEADLSGNPYFRVALAAELYDHRRAALPNPLTAAAMQRLPRYDEEKIAESLQSVSPAEAATPHFRGVCGAAILQQCFDLGSVGQFMD